MSGTGVAIEGVSAVMARAIPTRVSPVAIIFMMVA